MIGFAKILMALKIKDQFFWFLSQSQEDISNKLFVQSHFPKTMMNNFNDVDSESKDRSWWSKSRNIGTVGASYVSEVDEICIKQNKPIFFL